MPYEIRKRGDKWHVFNQETGEDKGASDSRDMAVAHMRALYAAENDERAYEPTPNKKRR